MVDAPNPPAHPNPSSTLPLLLHRPRPWRIAHRGAPTFAPENTLPSFAKALEFGVDLIELDVQMTRDGHIVVLHDATVDRTTDGHGPVASLTLAEVQRLDAGAHFGENYRGTRIPTLAEVLDLCRGRAGLNIELKSSYLQQPGFEEAVLQVIEASHFDQPLLFSSFEHYALRRMAQLAPAIPRGVLYTANPGPAAWQAMTEFAQAQFLHPLELFISPELIALAHTADLGVIAWTVDDPHRLQTLADWGVDGLISNRPDRLAAVRQV